MEDAFGVIDLVHSDAGEDEDEEVSTDEEEDEEEEVLDALLDGHLKAELPMAPKGQEAPRIVHGIPRRILSQRNAWLQITE